MASLSFARQLQGESYRVLRYFPLLGSPAIKPEEYAVNEPLIMARTISGVGLSFIAMAALYWTCPAVALLAAKYETLAILSSSILPFVPGIIELWRARSAADRLALEEYRKPTPSNKATDHICSSPRAFRRLLRRNDNLTKLDSQGMSLVNRIFSSCHRIPDVLQMLLSTNINLLAVDAEGTSLFMRAVANPDSTALRYILKSRKVAAATISEQDQAAIWRHARKAQTIRLLSQHRFNIDARDAEGATPLMHWAQRERDFSLFVAALNAGANPQLQNRQGVKASQVVPANTLLQQLLLQAEQEFVFRPVPLPQEKGLMAWLPWRPFAYKDSSIYTTDFQALLHRVYGVGIAAFTLPFFTPSAMWRVVTAMLPGVFVVSLSLLITELWRSEEEAERQAVVDHLTNPIPSKQSTATICKSVAAARLLVEHSPRPELLNKLDEDGGSLLGHYGVDSEVFKLLVNHGAHVLAGTQNSGFFLAIKDNRLDLLADILHQRLINIREMSEELQVEMWSSVQSEQAARLLRQYGFNPNVCNAEGNTALMRLAQQRSHLREVPLAAIQALLAVGADQSLINRSGQTARSLAVDPRIAGLL
jgi:ankyrin repeat protein